MTDVDVQQQDPTPGSDELIPFAQFLESTPPGARVVVSEVAHIRAYDGFARVSTPELQLHCGSDSCGGPRFFVAVEEGAVFSGSQNASKSVFLTYHCRNCRRTWKRFALLVGRSGQTADGHAQKYGEIPAFGPPTPARLIALVGPDRDSYLKGRRAENQGLGIAAYAYYRRVVENQKGRLLDEIIRVARGTGAPDVMVEALTRAKAESQFSKAVAAVKDAIPESLKINGQNPLTLLHGALSEGIHAHSDEVCLELAADIRLVLEELAERAAAALKDQAELNGAVSRLIQRAKAKAGASRE